MTHGRAPATRARRDQISALLAAGGLEACRDLVLDEITDAPDGIGWCTALTTAVLQAGDLRAAAALADLLARVRRGSARRPARRSNGRPLAPTGDAATQRVSAAGLRHDADQFALLRRRGLIGPEFDPVIAEYRALAHRLPEHGDHPLDDFAGAATTRVAATYRRIVHVADAPRVPRALSASWSPAVLGAQFVARPHDPVVIDDALTPAARDGLLRFSQESTVWSCVRGSDGRLASDLFDGFSALLLVQLAEEVRDALPGVLGGHRLEQVDAGKDVRDRAADPPAVAGSVEVTFWLTPTAANLDPGSGGLVVHGARPAVVPYRGNRAVVVPRGVVHARDAVRFAPGYECHRTEITLRYGRGD